MNILVLSGSPKGEYSITLQTVNYLMQRFPEHSYTVFHVGKQIRSYERDFAPAAEALEKAELILFVYPVYTFLVPSQLHRFVELMKERGPSLRGKFASQITTSKHFYDVTAHHFIRDNCYDLGLNYVRGLSADMEDLLTEKGRGQAEDFFRHLLWCVEQGISQPAPPPPPAFTPQPVSEREETPKPTGDVVIVADLAEEDRQLGDMIRRFRAALPRKSRVVNLREFPFKGGCLSCFRCAAHGECVYNDGFSNFLRKEIQTAEAIVLAFTVRDHSMGSRFKMYDDRQFCNGHRSVTMGKPFAYLISGPYHREENLRMVVEARAETGGNFLAGVATDETDPDREIDQVAAALCYAVEKGYNPPVNFYGVGGTKIFRDLIWEMQGLMREDHRFYKAHKIYDFPQKQWPRMLAMYLVGGLANNPKVMKKMGNRMNEGMLMPYKKVLKKM